MKGRWLVLLTFIALFHLCRVHFVFLLIFVLWSCFILLIFYEEHIAMHHTLMAGRLKDPLRGESDNAVAPDDVSRLDAVPQLVPYDDTSATFGTFGTSDATRNNKGQIQASMENGNKSNQPQLKPKDEGVGTINDKEATYDGTQVNEHRADEDDGEMKTELWPIRRGHPVSAVASRPLYAGQYAVLVMDEPPREFVLKKFTFCGIPLYFSRTGSLRKSQSGQTMNQKLAVEYGATSPQLIGIEDGVVQQQEHTTMKSRHVSRPSEILQQFAARLEEHMPYPLNLTTTLMQQRESCQLRMSMIETSFRRMFGDEFSGLIPVYETRTVNSILIKLYSCQAALSRAEYGMKELEEKLQAAEPDSKKQKKLKSHAEKLKQRLEKLRQQEATHQETLKLTRKQALGSNACGPFFAIFRSAKSAAIAAELNFNPVRWRGFNLRHAPDPENINWGTLERSWWTRTLRSAIMLIPIILIMLFPVGLITGFFSQLEVALCGNPSQNSTGSLTGSWFCSSGFWPSLFRNIVTGILPSILATIYQGVILPVYIYACAQGESNHISLSDLDRRCASLFFYWNVFNFFLGALLGGTILNGLRAAIDNPKNIFQILGQAVPASSNFFINYVMYRAFVMVWFRLFWPHACVFSDILRWLHIIPQLKTPRDKAFANPLRNCRFSRDLSIPIFAIYVAALSYAIVAPVILPFALFYFICMHFVWRYQQIYVYQSAYDYRGQMWMFSAHRLVACLGVMVLFTASIFFVRGGYVQGSIAVIGFEIFLIAFDRYIAARYDSIFTSTPIMVKEAAPRMELDPMLYVPPPLRPGAEGWYLEWGKTWQGWGAPRYGF